MSMFRTDQDKELLERLCVQHGVTRELIEELLKIERDYHLQKRRDGIYDRLRKCLQSSITTGETLHD